MKTMIDLTRKMTAGMSVYPGDPLFQSLAVADHDADGYRVTRLTFGSHIGTHLDAPYHSFEDGETLDSFPVERFFLSAAVVDLTSRLKTPGSRRFPPIITPALLAESALVFDSVDCVILRTGWSDRWGTPPFYDAFPSILPETAEWIADRPILMLGMETPSLSSLAHFALADSKEDDSFDDAAGRRMSIDEAALLHSDGQAHRILLGRTPPILLLEGLTRLDRLPAMSPGDAASAESLDDKIFDLACFPLLTERSDGSPVRAVAILRK